MPADADNGADPHEGSDARERAATTVRTRGAARFGLELSPLLVLCAAMCALGVGLRIHALSFPSDFLFDEHHFVENARNYLAGKPDLNDHPPLGKLFIALSISALGDSSLAWRLPSLLFGLTSIVVAGVTARRLFESQRAAFVAAAFVAADGFLITYSRAALLDGYLALCSLLAVLVATTRPSPRYVLLGGLLAGSAVSIKFSGLAVFVPLAIGIATAKGLKGRRETSFLGLLGVAVVAYLALYCVGLNLARQPFSPVDAVNETRRLYTHHAALTEMKNALVSGWVSWALPTKPIMMGYVERLGTVRAMTSLGNLALWWPGVALALVLCWRVLYRGLRATLRDKKPEPAAAAANAGPLASVAGLDFSGFLEAHGRSALILLGGAIGFVAPWAISHRDSYIYHFLPSYVLLVMLLAGFVAREARTTLVISFLSLVLVVLAFYAPIWSMFETSSRAVNLRLFLPVWR